MSSLRVAIQGQAGSFHDAVAQAVFTQTIDLVTCQSFAAVFQALAAGRADYGVVAAENSLYGSIHETYDQLLLYDYAIIGEVALPIHQQLIAPAGTKLANITTVTSHPAALDQCRQFLAQQLPHAQLIEHHDTAGAVADLASQPQPGQAAIASTSAAQRHGMTIVAANIEDEPDNITRFLTLSPRPQPVAQANQASLVLITSH